MEKFVIILYHILVGITSQLNIIYYIIYFRLRRKIFLLIVFLYFILCYIYLLAIFKRII